MNSNYYSYFRWSNFLKRVNTRNIKTLRKFLILLILVAVIISSTSSTEGCTNFKVRNENQVLFGNNEDHSLTITEVFITFIPSDLAIPHGAVFVGYDNKVASKIQGGMNDQGLAYDSTAVPFMYLNRHEERPAYEGTLGELVLGTCTNISEVIDVINKYQIHSENGDVQWFFADRTGKSLTVSPGINGELAFTQNNDSYQAISNHNIVFPDQEDITSGKERQQIASSLLNHVLDKNGNLIDSARDALNAVHQEGMDTNTIYSNIFDLTNLDIYLYYFHQFDEVVELNLIEELNKGFATYRILDLFPNHVRENAIMEHQEYERTFPFDYLIFFITIFLDLLFLILALKFLLDKILRRNINVSNRRTMWKYIYFSWIWAWSFLTPILIYKNYKWSWPSKIFRYPIFSHYSIFIFMSTLGPILLYKVISPMIFSIENLKSKVAFAFSTTLTIDLLTIILGMTGLIVKAVEITFLTFLLSCYTIILSELIRAKLLKHNLNLIYSTLIASILWLMWMLPLYFFHGFELIFLLLFSRLVIKISLFHITSLKYESYRSKPMPSC